MSEAEGEITIGDVLKAAGHLAGAARYVTGGRDVNGFSVSVPSIYNVHHAVKELERALDAYDVLMIELARQEKAR